MNWKPTSDTSSLTKAMDSKSDCLLFDMCSDALLESGSGVSLWDWLSISMATNSFEHYYGGGQECEGGGFGYGYGGSTLYTGRRGDGRNCRHGCGNEQRDYRYGYGTNCYGDAGHAAMSANDSFFTVSDEGLIVERI